MPKIIKVCEIQELTPGQVQLFQVEDKEISICRVNGNYYAFDDVCTHQYGSLSDGWLEGYTIECPLHGAQFDIRSGEVLCLPAVENIDTYKVVIDESNVFIELI